MRKLLSLFAIFAWFWTAAASAQTITPAQMRDANLTTTSTQNFVGTLNTFTAPRTLTIPDRSTLNSFFLQFADTANAVSATNTLTIQVAGGSLINGNATLVISAPGAYVLFIPSPSGYQASTVYFSSGYAAISASPITNSLGADVNLNNVSNYFDGPSVAQGIVGTWFASGTVTLNGATADQILCKLWDGTTVIASGEFNVAATTFGGASLSGFLAAPAGNLRISCRDVTGTTGKIIFNATGNSKDSTISAFRIN